MVGVLKNTVTDDRKRFLSEFIIKGEQYVRVYVYKYDNSISDDYYDSSTKLWVRKVDTPTTADILDISRYDIVDNSIVLYDTVPNGTTVYIEVASTPEELSTTLVSANVEDAREAAIEAHSYANEAHTYSDSALEYRNQAEGFKIDAENSANQAEGFKTDAANSANQANGYLNDIIQVYHNTLDTVGVRKNFIVNGYFTEGSRDVSITLEGYYCHVIKASTSLDAPMTVSTREDNGFPLSGVTVSTSGSYDPSTGNTPNPFRYEIDWLDGEKLIGETVTLKFDVGISGKNIGTGKVPVIFTVWSSEEPIYTAISSFITHVEVPDDGAMYTREIIVDLSEKLSSNLGEYRQMLTIEIGHTATTYNTGTVGVWGDSFKRHPDAYNWSDTGSISLDKVSLEIGNVATINTQQPHFEIMEYVGKRYFLGNVVEFGSMNLGYHRDLLIKVPIMITEVTSFNIISKVEQEVIVSDQTILEAVPNRQLKIIVEKTGADGYFYCKYAVEVDKRL